MKIFCVRNVLLFCFVVGTLAGESYNYTSVMDNEDWVSLVAWTTIPFIVGLMSIVFLAGSRAEKYYGFDSKKHSRAFVYWMKFVIWFSPLLFVIFGISGYYYTRNWEMNRYACTKPGIDFDGKPFTYGSRFGYGGPTQNYYNVSIFAILTIGSWAIANLFSYMMVLSFKSKIDTSLSGFYWYGTLFFFLFTAVFATLSASFATTSQRKVDTLAVANAEIAQWFTPAFISSHGINANCLDNQYLSNAIESETCIFIIIMGFAILAISIITGTTLLYAYYKQRTADPAGVATDKTPLVEGPQAKMLASFASSRTKAL